MNDLDARRSPIPNCDVCDGYGWVCENHKDKPWGGNSNRNDACECGAGVPCSACVPEGEMPDPSRYMDEIICFVGEEK